LEILSGKSLGRYNKNPKVNNQKYENTAIAIHFLTKEEGIKLVNIGGADITDGNLKIILGLIWTLILHYQISKAGDVGGAKKELLEWVRKKIPQYDIKGFTKDWNDGRALNALVDAIQPGLAPDHNGLNPENKKENNDRGIELAFNNFAIPRVIDAVDLANPRVDEQSVMTYISYFKNAEPKKTSDASKCRAFGLGLTDGVVNEVSNFSVEAPKTGKLEVKVEGPKSNAQVNITKTDTAIGVMYGISYTPKEPGEYKVHVTLDGEHIPGSIFHVTVLDQVSLGGEGKIRVFYSTTSSSEKGRSDVRDLQSLLEKKKVHLRPDFEPWIPVDVMFKADRDAVFKKAGTRSLPIVFIDDKYVGDYDTVNQLEEDGKLNALLNYNAK